MNGASAWLAELFEFELCSDCGRDADAHDCIPSPFGHPFARCCFEPEFDSAGNMIVHHKESIS